MWSDRLGNEGRLNGSCKFTTNFIYELPLHTDALGWSGSGSVGTSEFKSFGVLEELLPQSKEVQASLVRVADGLVQTLQSDHFPARLCSTLTSGHELQAVKNEIQADTMSFLHRTPDLRSPHFHAIRSHGSSMWSGTEQLHQPFLPNGAEQEGFLWVPCGGINTGGPFIGYIH